MEGENTCKHEYVKIYQRRLKGLERRLVATKAYLPVGFKITDFSHLSEGSFCFCTKCRARLFPKRTNADRALARQQLLLARQQAAMESVDINLDMNEEERDDNADEMIEKEHNGSVEVEELDVQATDIDELNEKAVEIGPEEDDS